jgi:hypothetical protein
LLADAVAVDFQYGLNGRKQQPRILELMEHYGVRVDPAMVLSASCGQVQIPQQVGMFRMNVAVNYPYFVRIGEEGFNSDNPAVSGLGEMIMPWASPLTLTVDQADSAAGSDGGSVKGTILCSSHQKSWTEASAFNLNPQQEWGAVVQQMEKNFEPQAMCAYLTGDFTSYFDGKSVPPVKEADTADALSQIQLSGEDNDRDIVPATTGRHLVVAGDSDFLSAQNAAPGNVAWLLNVVDWLTLDENLISIRSRTLVDRTLDTDQLGEGTSRTNVIRYANIFGMPVLVIILGLVIFFKRRETINASSSPSARKAGGATGSDNKEEQNA